MRWKLCQWTGKKEKWLLFVDAICPQPTSWMMMNDIKDYWYSVSINYKICGNVEIILKVLYSNAWNIINYTVDKQLNALQTRIQNVYIIIVSFTIYKFYCNVIKWQLLGTVEIMQIINWANNRCHWWTVNVTVFVNGRKLLLSSVTVTAKQYFLYSAVYAQQLRLPGYLMILKYKCSVSNWNTLYVMS